MSLEPPQDTEAREILSGRTKRGPLRQLLPFIGPAFVASVAYIDPGNFATNIEGGAKFGYTLLWVVVASNVMAVLIQTASAKLGIATGRNLAELCREHFPAWVVCPLWVLMELVAMATDLAEFLGAALGFNLLLGIPLFPAGLLTVVVTLLVLSLQQFGYHPIEAVIGALVGVVAACYLVETVLDHPDWSQVAFHSIVPQFNGTESVLLATGILGATIMPHAVYLHSALVQDRVVTQDVAEKKRLFRFEVVDVLIAMGIAGLVNAAMLVMAAATFYQTGQTEIGTIEQAHRTLEPLLGRAASWVFGISLLAAGLSSSVVGTMAGQVIMQGFLHWCIPIWVRRLVTIVPSLVVIGLGFDPTRTLVISQVVLSFGLPLALFPLLAFTASRRVMGELVNRPFTTALLSASTTLIVVLNLYLLFQTFRGV